MKSALSGLVLWLTWATAPAAFAAEKVSLINIDGAIGPATATYISRSIEAAQSQSAQCLIIQLNTPGGLLDSLRTDCLGMTQNLVLHLVFLQAIDQSLWYFHRLLREKSITFLRHLYFCE